MLQKRGGGFVLFCFKLETKQVCSARCCEKEPIQEDSKVGKVSLSPFFFSPSKGLDCIASYRFIVITFYHWDLVTILKNIKRTC